MAAPSNPDYEEIIVYEESEGTWESVISAASNFAACGIKGKFDPFSTSSELDNAGMNGLSILTCEYCIGSFTPIDSIPKTLFVPLIT